MPTIARKRAIAQLDDRNAGNKIGDSAHDGTARAAHFDLNQIALIAEDRRSKRPIDRLRATLANLEAHGPQYREALRIDPDFPEALSNLGATLANLGRLDEAIGEFRRLLSLRPDYAEAHNNLGVALGRAGRKAEAMEEYRTELRLEPGLAVARDNLQRLEKGN